MELLASGGSKTQEQEVILADGTRGIFLVNKSTFKDENGEVLGLVTVLQDVTELRMSEKVLEASEEKYRSFTQNFKGIAFQLDENLIPEFVHGAVEEITGYGEEDFMSSQITWEDLVYPEDQSAILKQIMSIKNSPYAYGTEFEYRIKRDDGKVIWVNELYQKIPGKDGKPDKYQGAVYNITEKKRLKKPLLR